MWPVLNLSKRQLGSLGDSFLRLTINSFHSSLSLLDVFSFGTSLKTLVVGSEAVGNHHRGWPREARRRESGLPILGAIDFAPRQGRGREKRRATGSPR